MEYPLQSTAKQGTLQLGETSTKYFAPSPYYFVTFPKICL